MNEQEIKKIIRDVPDFPKKGILFKDLTTAFAKPECLDWFSEEIVKLYKDKKITKVLGIESRGFIVGSIVAKDLHAGFVPIRKKGKLPSDVAEISYQKEYGIDTIQIHKDAITPDDIVLIHDDLLATGGTMEAAVQLVKQMGAKKIYVNFLVELTDLEGTKNISNDIEITSLIKF